MKAWIETLSTAPRVEWVVRWILGIVFVYAGTQKILDPGGFAKIIYGYQLFPGILINAIAIVLPWVEVYAGLFLALGVFPRSSAVLINILLAAFVLAISINLIRGHEFDCGCFSVNNNNGNSSTIELLLRDAVMFCFGLIPIVFRGRRVGCIGDRIRCRTPHS